MKRKNKKKTPKERNIFAYHLAIRSGNASGKHVKTNKALRRKDKVEIQKKDYYNKVA